MDKRNDLSSGQNAVKSQCEIPSPGEASSATRGVDVGGRPDTSVDHGAPGNSHAQMAPATCELCRGQSCMLGYPASFRYVATNPPSWIPFARTKMLELIKPMEENQFKPPVKAYGGEDNFWIVLGTSLCAYVRSHEPERRRKMDPKARAARERAAAKNKQKSKATPVGLPLPTVTPPTPPQIQATTAVPSPLTTTPTEPTTSCSSPATAPSSTLPASSSLATPRLAPPPPPTPAS